MKSMAEFQLVLALGRALALDTPGRQAIWDELMLSVTNGQLLNPSFSKRSPPLVHRRLYRDLVRETLPDGWTHVAEHALLRSPADWLVYLACLNAPETPPLTRLEKLLRLKNTPEEIWTPPLARVFFECLESVRLDWTEMPNAKTPPVAPADPLPLPKVQAFLTKSQQAVLGRMQAMAELYFSTPPSGGLRPRFSPLLIGPTGSGKSAVIERVAKSVAAHLMRVTVSEWVPNGARDESSPTLRILAATLLEHERVILFIDELDKLSDSTGTWNRSCQCEIFDVLERKLPGHLLKKADAERLITQIRDRLWIVGAGTWNHLQPSQANTRPLGFAATSHQATEPVNPTTDIVDRALKEGFPAELFGRFHSVPFFLHYPDEHETMGILERLGLVKLAEDTGRADLIQKFSWRPFGLRNLESLFADLLVARHSQAISVDVEPLPAKAPLPSPPHPELAVD